MPEVITFLTTIHALFHVVSITNIIRKKCRAINRVSQNPPVLSSDEEDDAEYLRSYNRRLANVNEDEQDDTGSNENESVEDMLPYPN